MELLIIGGTVFLGRTIVEAALQQGHRITLFNRGKSNPDLFPQVEKIIGDRDSDFSALEGRRWDAVIDTCGYIPCVVRRSVERLVHAVDHYTFISTVSVYADQSKSNIDEMAPVGVLEDESLEEMTEESYGPLKALCEQEVIKTMPVRSLVIRPGLIVGSHDPSDRFTYWVQRVSQGGEVLAPKPKNAPIEFIDVRDLAEWILHMAESRQTGIYNAVGPAQPLSMEQFLNTCRSIGESDAEFIWVEGAFLLQNNVQPWTEMPMWIPADDPTSAGIFSVNGEKARKAGLHHHPIEETIRATLKWAKTRSDGYEMKAGISRKREEDLLNLWKAWPSV